MIHKLFTWPIQAVLSLGRKIQEEADRELYDLVTIQRELVHLELMNEIKEISDDSFTLREEELLERYRIAKQLEMGLEDEDEDEDEDEYEYDEQEAEEDAIKEESP
jgi:hypothetical protein